MQDFVWQMFSQLASALYRCHSGQDAPAPGRESELNQPKPVVGIRRKDEEQIIIHRDLKPENVFLTNGSTVKLGDFGLSKLLSAHDFASTYVGTPFYMSPEICSSERYSGKSDIWSLGCIMYELCTLEPPFNARSHLELIQKIRLGKVKPLPSRYSKELGMIIATCLRVNPDERPDTAQMLQTNGIKFARMKLQSELAHGQDSAERDALLEKLKYAEKENATLREEVVYLKDAEARIERRWHTKATLAIEERCAERFAAEQMRLNALFESEVEKKLQTHLASLPAAQGVTVSVRSSTPPPQSKSSSFATIATAASSPERQAEDDSLETDITSLSLGDDISPLGPRVKPAPRRTGRTPFSRARTAVDMIPGSPMDVQMADPSPMPPNSLRGLALSPRRELRSKQGVSSQPLRRNIFAEAAKLQPSSGLNVATSAPDLFAEQGDNAFADDILEDDEQPESPSRPTSGGSSTNNKGDPFKSFNVPAVRKPRPSLGRQQTMPVQMPTATNTRRTTLLSKKDAVAPRPTSRGTEKENRPPSNNSRLSTVPVLATSPKRNAPAQKKELTPSRQAPKAPGAPANRTPLAAARRAGDMMKLAQRNALQGRTLVELSQAPQSPTKWDRLVESGEVAEMPSPFLERKGRMVF